MVDFGAATQEEQVVGAGTPSLTVDIDPNDPQLTSESLEDNQTGDAYAVPPPIPDGKWRAKLVKDGTKANGAEVRDKPYLVHWASPPKPCLVTDVELEIINVEAFDCRFDGMKMTDYFIKTFIDPRNENTSQASTIVRKSGGTLAGKTTDRERMDALHAQVAKNAEVIVETVWEAQCKACGDAAEKEGKKKPKAFATGMHRFPQNRDGSHSPELACPACKAVVRARPRINRYFSLAEAKATHK